MERMRRPVRFTELVFTVLKLDDFVSKDHPDLLWNCFSKRPYWHFVDVVWLFIFTMLYVSPYALRR